MADRNGIPLTPGNNPNREFIVFQSIPDRLGIDGVYWGPSQRTGSITEIYAPDVLIHFGAVPVVTESGIVKKTYAETAAWIKELTDAGVLKTTGNPALTPRITHTKDPVDILSQRFPTLAELVNNDDNVPGPLYERLLAKDVLTDPATLEEFITRPAAEIQEFLNLESEEDGEKVQNILSDIYNAWKALDDTRKTLGGSGELPRPSDPDSPLPGKNEYPPTTGGGE